MYSCIAIKCYYPLNIEKHFTYFDNIIRFYTCLMKPLLLPASILYVLV